LLAVLELGLEADHVPQGSERIVLAQLDHRIGPAASARIVEPDRFHRPVAQGFAAALRHHLDRHAAFEIGRVLFPLVERHFLALDQRGDEIVILRLVERAVDVVLPALIPARGHPGDIHVDAVAVDDRRDRVEKGEGAFACFRSNRLGERRPGQRAGGDDRGIVGKRIDPLANHRDVRVLLDRAGDFGGEFGAIDRERRARGHAVLVGGAHDQRAEVAHFLVEQPDRIMLGIVRAEAVRADHLGEAVGLVRRRRVAAAAHFTQPHAQAGLGQLPRGFRSGEPAADDVDVEVHRGLLVRARAAIQL